MPTKVYYNGLEIPGTPFVSRSKAPLDGAGSEGTHDYQNRWGMVDTITLNGTLTDIDFGNVVLNIDSGTRKIKIYFNHLDNGQSPTNTAAGLGGTSNTFWTAARLQQAVASLNTQFSRNHDFL